jgi:zinc protease
VRLLLPFLCLALAAAAPAQREVKIPDHPESLRFGAPRFEVPRAERYRHRLGNGVAVYVVEDRTLPMVDMALAARVGDWLDVPDRVGLASFTGSMMRRGGTLARSADAFDEEADFLGAEINSVAGSTRSGATLNVASRVLEPALGLFCEMVKTPRFDEARVALAKANLRESLGRRTDDPLEVLDREWQRLLYGASHYRAHEVTPRDLDALTPQAMKDFHRAAWRPDGMVLAVSGDVDTKDVLARLERCFAGWAPPAGPPPPWPPPEPSDTPRSGLYFVERDIPQAKILLGHLGPKRRGWDDPEEPALVVLNEILGGSASRLLRRLRGELGLVYGAQSNLELGLHGPGEFQVFLETENANAARVIDLARAELRRLRDEPPSEPELTFVKKALLDGFPLLFDTASEVAGRFAEDEYLGRPHEHWHTWRRRIERVTAEQVRQAARRHLRPDQMVVVVAGRWAEISRGAAAAGLKPDALAGGPVVRLPARDPLTLEPRP